MDAGYVVGEHSARAVTTYKQEVGSSSLPAPGVIDAVVSSRISAA
jgi:hypothetical protein